MRAANPIRFDPHHVRGSSYLRLHSGQVLDRLGRGVLSLGFRTNPQSPGGSGWRKPPVNKRLSLKRVRVRDMQEAGCGAGPRKREIAHFKLQYLFHNETVLLVLTR